MTRKYYKGRIAGVGRRHVLTGPQIMPLPGGQRNGATSRQLLAAAGAPERQANEELWAMGKTLAPNPFATGRGGR